MLSALPSSHSGHHEAKRKILNDQNLYRLGSKLPYRHAMWISSHYFTLEVCTVIPYEIAGLWYRLLCAQASHKEAQLAPKKCLHSSSVASQSASSKRTPLHSLVTSRPWLYDTHAHHLCWFNTTGTIVSCKLGPRPQLGQYVANVNLCDEVRIQCDHYTSTYLRHPPEQAFCYPGLICSKPLSSWTLITYFTL